jgi:hypothetical protein
VYSFAVVVGIQASPQRVWRALCDPAEVVRWDTGVEAALDAPPDYPQPGQNVRWRYVSGPFRLLRDRPQEVVPERRLRSLLSVGPLRFEETYTLKPHDRDCQLSAAMEVRLPVPALGWLFERLYLGPQTRRTVEASMRSLKEYCEAG